MLGKRHEKNTCHTKKTKNGDGKERNVTPELFKEKILLADIKIVAITNHNAFDCEQFSLLGSTVSEFCQIWPGVEIDVKGENKFPVTIMMVFMDMDKTIGKDFEKGLEKFKAYIEK